MNTLAAYQAFQKKYPEYKDLGKLLWSICNETERVEHETRDYDGIGYEVKTSVEYIPTKRAKEAYQLLINGPKS